MKLNILIEKLCKQVPTKLKSEPGVTLTHSPFKGCVKLLKKENGVVVRYTKWFGVMTHSSESSPAL